MKLVGSTANKISKDKIGKNFAHLWITEVTLVLCLNWLSVRLKGFAYICS